MSTILDPAVLDSELARVRREYNTVRLHAAVGYVTPDDEHHGRGPHIRCARAAGMLARERGGSRRIKSTSAPAEAPTPTTQPETPPPWPARRATAMTQPSSSQPDPAATSYSYDGLGDRTSTASGGQTTSYSYNQAGELTGMTPPAGTASSYTYDGTGLLANRVNGSTSTSFAWDTSGSLSLLLTDGTNSYIYGPGGVPIEQLSSSGTPTYLHHDQTGSTRLLTSSAGAATGTQTYAPFGTSSAHTGTITTPFGFAGQYIDAHTGLQYLRARWYDPGTAQFLSVDPLSSLTRSPYTYAFDNPINLTDPNGECGALCYVGIGLGVVSAATGVGEVFAGTLGIADGLSAGVSAASGVAASTLDGKTCITHGGVACVGLATGLAGTAAGVTAATAGAVAGLTSGATASTAETVGTGATAIGSTFGLLGIATDGAAALAGPGSTQPPTPACG